MRRPCGWRQRSRWIGFVTAPPGCTCRDGDSDVCEACHNSWTWLDGSPVSLLRFAPRQPSDNRRCAYMSFTGSWYSAECDTQLYSVCKKGTYQLNLFLCTIQFIVLLSQRIFIGLLYCAACLIRFRAAAASGAPQRRAAHVFQ